jgi:hypothetical protein
MLLMGISVIVHVVSIMPEKCVLMKVSANPPPFWDAKD